MSAPPEQTGLIAQTQRIVDLQLLNTSDCFGLASGLMPTSDRDSRLRYAKAARGRLTDRSASCGTLLADEKMFGDHRNGGPAGGYTESGVSSSSGS
jgi:hypothetical protein